MSTTSQTQGNLATIDMMLQPVNDRIDTVNGELIDGGVPGKMDKLDNTKEAIRQAITHTGVELSPDEPFAGYAEKISAIPDVKWQPDPSWWNIKEIFKNAPATMDGLPKISIHLLRGITNTTDLSAAGFPYMSGYRVQYVTSDGYQGNAYVHTWDTTKDKVAADGVPVRYILIYGNDLTRYSRLYELPILWSYFEGSHPQSLRYSTAYNTLASSLLEYVEFNFDGISQNSNQMFDDFAFRNCRNLTEVIVPSHPSLSAIPSYMFNGCTRLRKLVYSPAYMRTIYSDAFTGCYALTEFVCPNLTSAKVRTLFSLSALLKLDAPKLTDIGTESTALPYQAIEITVGTVNAGAAYLIGPCLRKLTIGDNWASSLDFSGNFQMSRAALLDVFTKLSTTQSGTITLNSMLTDRLSEADKAVVTNKGWVLTIK